MLVQRFKLNSDVPQTQHANLWMDSPVHAQPLPVWQACECVNTVQRPRLGTLRSGIWGGTTSLPLSHFLITSKGDEVGGGGGSHFNENGPRHKSGSNQVHLQFRLKDSKH